MRHADVELHNVAALRPAEETELDLPGGHHLGRLPDAVRAELNGGAQRRYCHPAGVELRFVPDGPVEVTLSATEPSAVEVFWGPFHERRVTVGPEPTTVEVELPEPVAALREDRAADLAFAPGVCRLRFAGAHRGGPVALHDVAGERRPPEEAELPELTYLAYGTSITEGEAPSAEQLTYVSETARRLGADLRNLGTCGSAYCEPEIAEYIADQEFDVASLALSVNMIDAFELPAFRERTEFVVRTVADAHPDTPIAAITLYPYYDDLREDGDREKAAAFRETLREIVADADRPNLHCLEGPELLDPAGLGADLLHPADAGMITMGERLSAELDALL